VKCADTKFCSIFDLAELYEVENKRLKEVVRRNISRFPADFMFELMPEEHLSLRT